jgi:dinuclear metal center YbgI/SA1388 family protein
VSPWQTDYGSVRQGIFRQAVQEEIAVVRRRELEEWLNGYLCIDVVSDFIPNGLQVEGADEIQSIVTAVSINLRVIEAAVKAGAKAIIVHHGLFWKKDEQTIRGYRRKRFKLLLQHDINLFNYHLPLDCHPDIGHNRMILQGLGAEVLNDTDKKRCYGMKGVFRKPVAFEELVERVNKTIGAESRYFHYGTDMIQSIYVVSGGGRNELEQVISMGVDAYLTGDAKESTGYIAEEAEVNYIYAGHYNTERLGIIELGKQIQNKFDVGVQFVEVENPL